MGIITPILFLLLASLNVSAAANGQKDEHAPVSTYSEPINENANDKVTCARKWDRFYKSQVCFAPYRNKNGTMKPGALENCTDIQPPNQCPPDSRTF